MKRIFEFLGIIGLLLCILAAFSLAEIAYGETINYVQEHQYSTPDQDCAILRRD